MAKWQVWHKKEMVDSDSIAEWAFPKGNVAFKIRSAIPPEQGFYVLVKERGKILFSDGIVHKNEEQAHAHADSILSRHWAALAVLDTFSDADKPFNESAVWEWADVPNSGGKDGQTSVGVPGGGYVNFIISLENGKHYIDVMVGHDQLFRDLTSHATLDAAKLRSDVVWKSNIALLSLLDRNAPVPGKKVARQKTSRAKSHLESTDDSA